MGGSGQLGRLLIATVLLLTMSVTVATAQDATWKQCELSGRDPDRSIAACSKILAQTSGYSRAGAFHNRGMAFAWKGIDNQAISDLTEAIRLDPKRAYHWEDRGEVYTKQGNYQQGIADISEAIRLDPIPRAFRFQARGNAYRGLGDLTRAVADYNEAIRLDPNLAPFGITIEEIRSETWASMLVPCRTTRWRCSWNQRMPGSCWTADVPSEK